MITETIGVFGSAGGQVPLRVTKGINSEAFIITAPVKSGDAGVGTGGATTPAAPVPNATATASSCPGDASLNSITTGRASATLCKATTKSRISTGASAGISAYRKSSSNIDSARVSGRTFIPTIASGARSLIVFTTLR